MPDNVGVNRQRNRQQVVHRIDIIEDPNFEIGTVDGAFLQEGCELEFSRLGFKADIIERLSSKDRFQVITPERTFEMTKAEFYRDFDNVVRSLSYRDRGLYHYPRTPAKALKYLK